MTPSDRLTGPDLIRLVFAGATAIGLGLALWCRCSWWVLAGLVVCGVGTAKVVEWAYRGLGRT